MSQLNPYDPYDPGYTPPPPPPPPSYPPIITTSSLPNGAIGTAYAQTLTVVEGTPPYHLAVAAGALPAGLTLNSATGAITGTPTTAGMFYFVVTVTDTGTPTSLTSSAALSISIPSQPAIVNTSLPNATVGVPYFAALLGTAGAAPYGFRVFAGGLPSGITLAATGGITGTPTTPGVFPVTIQIYDSGSPQGLNTSSFTLTVVAASIANAVKTIDQTVIMGCADGGLYVVVPGQRHDENNDGSARAISQTWIGVPNTQAKQTVMSLGGATVSAKGNGNLQVSAIDQDGRVTALSTDQRPMTLSATETTRDFGARAVPQSEAYGLALRNWAAVTNPDGITQTIEPIVDAWFEVHSGCLYVRPVAASRKA